MPSPLDALCGPGKPLAKEPPDPGEVAGLKRSGLARLRDAQNEALALESRFDLAYNAAHALSLAALRAHGYRSGNRYVVFQVLPHTLRLGPDVWRVLAKCHDIRNRGEYEGDLNVNERLVTDLIAACLKVAEALLEALEDKLDIEEATRIQREAREAGEELMSSEEVRRELEGAKAGKKGAAKRRETLRKPA